MALLLVASTSVPSLWRMYCPEMGSSRTAWVDIEACCHDDGSGDQAQVDVHCCDYTVAQAELSTLEHSTNGRLTAAYFVDGSTAHDTKTGVWPNLAAYPGWPDRLPPRTACERIALLQVMRV
ncbi:MAG: hypothetical protein IPG92_12635 [Flavobacteriales bacterium]|nr:hypothetical protein [Flavobacteriales bacterium]